MSIPSPAKVVPDKSAVAKSAQTPLLDLRSQFFNQRARTMLISTDPAWREGDTISPDAAIEVVQVTSGLMLELAELDSARVRMARMLVAACRHPQTKSPIFMPEDEESLLNVPYTGLFSRLIDAVQNLSSIEVQIKEQGKS